MGINERGVIMSYKLAGVIWNDDGTMATKELTELTPLQALNKIAGITNYDGGKNLKALGNFHKKEFALIETTLKDYERVMVEKNDLFKRWAKEHQTLEIIKEKKVNIGLFSAGYKELDYQNYKKHLELGFQIIKQVSEKPLTQEEYDLLKEILK